MGQFSVEICHLVGQFSMKLNTEAGEGGFFVTPVAPGEMIQVIDTTFPGDLVTTPDPTPSNPTLAIGVLNGGATS